MATSKLAGTSSNPIHRRLVPLGLAARLVAGLLASLAASVTASTAARAADEARLKSYGQHLSQECTSCHRVDGIDNGIPPIAGWPVEVFMRTIKSFQEGQRTNPVMVSVAKSLEEDQVRALALYWSSVPRVLPKDQPKAKK
jgi:cytochrome c553